MADTIQLTITKSDKKILIQNNIPKDMSVSDFLKSLWIKNIIEAKALEKKHYNSIENNYGPFKNAEDSINFLKRYN